MRRDADLVIVGAGPAGLEAALIAARARLRVRVIDAGEDEPLRRRNARGATVEGVIGLDGDGAEVLRARAHASLARCGVRVEAGVVLDVLREPEGLRVVLEPRRATHDPSASETGVGHPETGASPSITARRVLLASGVQDVLPALPGLAETWGRTSFSCPYCHGFERPEGGTWGVLAHEIAALKMAPLYTRWAREVILFTDERIPPPELRAAHERAGLTYVTERVLALRHEGDRILGVVVEGGREVAVDTLVHRPPRTLGSLVKQLGLAVDPDGGLSVSGRGETSMKDVLACGDLTTSPHQVVFALADGARAAMAIVSALAFEDRLG